MAERFTLILSNPVVRQRAHKLIDTAPDRAVVTISEPKRTNDQNAKLHAMLTDIKRHKPQGRVHSIDAWKALMMAYAGFKPIFEPSLDGQGVVPIGYKSSGLTKAEFSDLIEACYAYGGEHGVAWSEPSPYE